MARETTRRVNRRVVEALEAAQIAGVRSAEGWLALMQHLSDVGQATRLHNDLADEANALYSRLDEVRHQIHLRLTAERDGDGR
jgi:hypothetical protein